MHTKFFPDPCGQVVQNYHLVLRGKKPEDVKFLPPPQTNFLGKEYSAGDNRMSRKSRFFGPNRK